MSIKRLLGLATAGLCALSNTSFAYAADTALKDKPSQSHLSSPGKETAKSNAQDWFKKGIFYEVHVKTYCDTDGNGYGDFKGLMQKLDYLQKLGVTTIWLLPFYPSPLKDDGYDIADYKGINPLYGNMDDFKSFLAEAHKRNIKVITELVINHTSDQHPWFQRARKAAPGSPERNFYVWSDSDKKYKDARIIFVDTEKSNWTYDPEAKEYYWHRFFSHQPDLNYDNPEVIKAVVEAMKYWLDMGVDGLRLDAIPYLVERDGTNCENLPETHEVLKKLRKELDNYKGKIFLAEANQWPEDTVKYFGNEDECQMAFHFPIMPRLFMSVAKEDRTPIIETMMKTPAIPESCQWGIFLRNHDELTLEMVNDEERAFMYKTYAPNPRMRCNIGIRRRLAPLMDFNQSKIRLLDCMLLSLTGTPIIYYGDELGMGDNIQLKDRDGVRTPMQWSSAKNGGFSEASTSKLYCAPIDDAVAGFEKLNADSEAKKPNSLLNWLSNAIRVRQQYPVFGKGSLEFADSDNSKVLTYLRKYKDETVLVVANLSGSSQTTEIKLGRFDGRKPEDLFSKAKLAAISKTPYKLTLAPYGFYWLKL